MAPCGDAAGLPSERSESPVPPRGPSGSAKAPLGSPSPKHVTPKSSRKFATHACSCSENRSEKTSPSSLRPPLPSPVHSPPQERKISQGHTLPASVPQSPHSTSRAPPFSLHVQSPSAGATPRGEIGDINWSRRHQGERVISPKGEAGESSCGRRNPHSSASPGVPQSASCPGFVHQRRGAGDASLRSFLGTQMGWRSGTGMPSDLSETELQARREGIYNFLHVPWKLEPLLLFGTLTCLDAFIQQFTFMPLRMMSALLKIVRGQRPTAAQSRDLLRGLLIALVSFLLLRINMSHAYHSVRNQSTMKLYVVFNVLEVFDKLFSSFGLDVLESLDWALTKRQSRLRSRGGVLLDFCIAFVIVFLHTLVLFYQAVALNVAVNSHNNVLLTLLISNNFTELKTHVFKRCESENLFQVSCADSVERFQLFLYLLVVTLQFLFVQKAEHSAERLQELGGSLLMVLAGEMVVDWIKHSFVIKFNRMRPEVYSKFMHILCADASQQAGGSKSDPLAAVATRMGFVPIPLLCLVIRVVGNDVWPLLEMRSPSGPLFCFLLWLTFCALKVLTSICILGVSCVVVERRREEVARSEAMGVPASGSEQALRLDGIGRYTLHGKQIC